MCEVNFNDAMVTNLPLKITQGPHDASAYQRRGSATARRLSADNKKKRVVVYSKGLVRLSIHFF